MLLQPLANASDGTLVSIRRWMRTVKHPHFTKQKYRNPASRMLFDLRAKLNEQGFNIAPLDVCAGGSGKNQFNNSLALPFHECMVPLSGTAPRGAGDGSQLTRL
jgi:hypothetical protein